MNNISNYSFFGVYSMVFHDNRSPATTTTTTLTTVYVSVTVYCFLLSPIVHIQVTDKPIGKLVSQMHKPCILHFLILS